MNNSSSLCNDSKPLLVWDKLAFYKRCRDKEDRVRMLIHMFLEDMPVNFQSLDDAMEKGDFSDIRRIAHTVKGVSANVGGNLLNHSVSNLEEAAENKNVDLCARYLKQAQRHLLTLTEELNNHSDEGG